MSIATANVAVHAWWRQAYLISGDIFIA